MTRLDILVLDLEAVRAVAVMTQIHRRGIGGPKPHAHRCPVRRSALDLEGGRMSLPEVLYAKDDTARNATDVTRPGSAAAVVCLQPACRRDIALEDVEM